MELSMPEKKKTPGARRWVYAVIAGLAFCCAGAVFFWYTSGRLALEGLFMNATLPVYVRDGVRIQSVNVTPGDEVQPGDELVRLDDGELRQTLEKQRQRLAELELLMPPTLLAAPAGQGGHGGQAGQGGQASQGGQAGDRASVESMTQKLERLRSMEREAEERLQAAADREAEASVYYNRVSLRKARGALSEQDRAAAEGVLRAARQETAQARKHFEDVSGQRAAAVADIQRLKDLHAAAGLLPEAVRVRQYEEQRRRLMATMRALEELRVLAPDTGVVLDVAVEPGGQADASRPALVLRPTSRPALVRALADAEALSKLRIGQEAAITLKGSRDIALSGCVTAFAPPAREGDTAYVPGQSLRTVVWLEADMPEDPQLRELVYALPQNTQAEIVVALRAPLRAFGLPQENSMDAQFPVNGASAADFSDFYGPAGQADAQAAPQAQNAGQIPLDAPGSGAAAVPVVRAGSPEAMGMSPEKPVAGQNGGLPSAAGNTGQAGQAEKTGPPVLPAMKARGPFSGPAPAARPGNNPSLASPEILRGADNPRPLLP